MPLLVIADIVWDVVEDIRGTIAMMMFILEESIQTAMMAQYLAFKENMLDDAWDINIYIMQNLQNPLKELASSGWAKAAYPLNQAYESFADSTWEALSIYRRMIRKKQEELGS